MPEFENWTEPELEGRLLNVGFTGTRGVLTIKQIHELSLWLDRFKMNGYTHLHHGDCFGADELSHYLALHIGLMPVKHPPIIQTYRAFCRGGIQSPEKDYLVRNRDIVNASCHMIACPKTKDPQLRSGTWSTIRYAIKSHIPVEVIYP